MKISITKKNTAFTQGFHKDFQKLELDEQKQIKKRLTEIFEEPQKAIIKKLTNHPLAQYRVRIGHFRLLFSVDKKNQMLVFSHCKKRKDLY